MRRLLARVSSLAAPLAFTILLTNPLVAQQQAGQPRDTGAKNSDSASHKAARLFRGKEPVVMSLQADFKTVFKDRDSMSTKRYPAILKYVDENKDTVSLNVQLGTRGHYRLRKCDFVPLKIYFDKEKSKGTLFGGEGALKFTPHCQNGDRHAQNIFIEYAVYGMYNKLTPVSLEARLATVTYVNPNDPKFTVTRPAFWTQDEDDMAKELRGKVLMQQGGTPDDMDPRQMAVSDLFQYMIGNTDFSLSYLHNYRILQTDSSTHYFPMAYDFDWSGLVNAPYATPDYRLPIKRVTDRLYRGACHPADLMSNTVFPLFKDRREAMYDEIRKIPGLSPGRMKEAIEYLDEFYKELDNSNFVKRTLREPCSR